MLGTSHPAVLRPEPLGSDRADAVASAVAGPHPWRRPGVRRGRPGPLVLIATLALWTAGPALAQDDAPARLEPVVVTVTRMEQRADEAPASVTVVTREDIAQSPSQTLDDLLRQVPGFSLFRRSSSLVTHPTTQGVSLRGIGPSGTSRALVLVDGVPVNDPFGGWVYWNRIPLQSIEQVEVVRGGGSSVWGNYALGGVIHVISRRPTERAAFLEASQGTQGTTALDVLVTEARGSLRLSGEANYFRTDGYQTVLASRRGPIDINADSEHKTFNGRLELVRGQDLSLFATGNYYDESRGNGTRLQVNDTQAGSFALGGRARTAETGEWSFTLFGQFQRFRSTFTTQALDRRSESLALDQSVPSTSLGGALQWNRRFAAHEVSAGVDGRWIDGETTEHVFAGGNFVRTRDAGGEQVVAGAFVQDVFTLDPRWELVAGLRTDAWLSDGGFRRDTPPPAGVPARQSFADIERLAVSPRVAVLFHATPTTDVRASAYQGFRVPTLNELYRVFRVRNDVTAANEHLRPERMTGGELSLQQRWGPVEARVTGYWNDVKDLIANVTLTRALPDCPTATTCRQRQNLGLARIRGVEAEVELRLARQWRLLGSYLFTDARVADASRQPALEGKRLAQVPTHAFSLGARYQNPALVNVALTGRYVGNQFEDDLNTLPLGSFFVVDVLLWRPVTKWGELFFGVENVFNETYAVGRTSEGVVTTGAPRLVRGGVRLAF